MKSRMFRQEGVGVQESESVGPNPPTNVPKPPTWGVEGGRSWPPGPSVSEFATRPIAPRTIGAQPTGAQPTGAQPTAAQVTATEAAATPSAALQPLVTQATELQPPPRAAGAPRAAARTAAPRALALQPLVTQATELQPPPRAAGAPRAAARTAAPRALAPRALVLRDRATRRYGTPTRPPDPRRKSTPTPRLDAPLDAPDALIDRLALGQQGVVTRAQLLEAGLTRGMIARRVESGRFAPFHRGVYRVGSGLFPYAAESAAILACRPDALLSHRSAARVWGILNGRPGEGPVHVMLVRSGRGRRREGVRFHVVAELNQRDRASREGLPLTSATRTLFDLASLAARRAGSAEPSPHRSIRPLSTSELEQAVATAERAGLVSLDELRERLQSAGRSPGVRLLREIVGVGGGPAFVRSEAEALLLDHLRAAGIEPGATNARVGRYEVDMLWRKAGLGVEVDGFAFHGARHMFEGDRRRDAELQAAGIKVTRVTWNQLKNEPQRVVATIARTLGRAEGERAILRGLTGEDEQARRRS